MKYQSKQVSKSLKIMHSHTEIGYCMQKHTHTYKHKHPPYIHRHTFTFTHTLTTVTIKT